MSVSLATLNNFWAGEWESGRVSALIFWFHSNKQKEVKRRDLTLLTFLDQIRKAWVSIYARFQYSEPAPTLI